MDETGLKQLINQIEGVNPEEMCFVLYSLVGRIQVDGVVLEIGNFKGRMTICFAKAIQEAKKGILYTIDSNLLNAKTALLNNIKRFGVEDYVRPIFSHSAKANKGWDRPIKLIWLDNDVNYITALCDFLLWERYLVVGGAIAIGRPNLAGVRRFINEIIVKSGRFRDINISDNVFYAFKQMETPTVSEWHISYYRFLYALLYSFKKIFYLISKALFPRLTDKELGIKKVISGFFERLIRG